MGDNIDSELLIIINKLTSIQKEVGGAKKSAVLGEDGKIDRFLDLRQTMTERIASVKESMESIKQLEKANANPKEIIIAQSKIRSELTKLNEDYTELQNSYNSEAKKKRSKFTSDDLALRQQMLVKLQREIKALRDMQRAGHVQDYQTIQLASMEDSELFKAPKKGGSVLNDSAPGGSASQYNRNFGMTDQDRQGLQLIKERDSQMDQEILGIGKDVDVLLNLARTANEEVKMQNKMLDVLETKIDDVHEHVTNLNVKLKATLEDARKSDKICVDIFCVILLIGMIIVLVKLSRENEGK